MPHTGMLRVKCSNIWSVSICEIFLGGDLVKRGFSEIEEHGMTEGHHLDVCIDRTE